MHCVKTKITLRVVLRKEFKVNTLNSPFFLSSKLEKILETQGYWCVCRGKSKLSEERKNLK